MTTPRNSQAAAEQPDAAKKQNVTQRTRSPIMATALDPSSQNTQAEASNAQAPQKVLPVLTGVPSNVPEAIAQGWHLAELQGSEDCLYRAIAAARSFMKDNDALNIQQAKAAGAEIRMSATKHARKHSARLSNWFALDILDITEKHLGKKGPQNIDEWITLQEENSTRGDGLAWHCISESLGLTLTVWKLNPQQQWDRYSFAPKCSNVWPVFAKRKNQPP